MDVVVNAVWLAFHWAKVDKDDVARDALEKLILNWPFDFTLFPAEDGKQPPEEQFFQAMVSLPVEVEMLRD